MIKKIVLATSLLVTLAQAEIDQRGFFVGLDLSSTSTNLKYDNNAFGTAFTVKGYGGESSENTLSYKVGYQYYFTRIYARMSSYEYKDATRNKYTIKGTNYEINADYIPTFYTNKNKTWNIRGVFGLGVGYSSSKLENYDPNLLPAGLTAGDAKNLMEYGYQIGIMSETSIGLSVELGLRYRQGNLLEFTDGQNDSTFFRDETAYYLGVNYLF